MEATLSTSSAMVGLSPWAANSASTCMRMALGLLGITSGTWASALKATALALWQERAWELSTVALGVAAFERALLLGRAHGGNRKLCMAVCLLLPFRLLIGTRATTNAAPSA
jgi:hypothetical protein